MTDQSLRNPVCKEINNKPRLYSLDALRGFDMFWIIGGEGLFAAFAILWPLDIFNTLADQMRHSTWHGLTAYDLIFPLFIFLVGVSLGLSTIDLRGQPWSKRQPYYRKFIKRFILLMVLGILYNHGWGSGLPATISDIRFASVLAKIAIAWGVTALIVWHCSERVLWITCFCIMTFYALALEFVSVETFGAGDYTQDNALNTWFDLTFLPGATYQDRLLDPEGLLANISSIVNALLGAIAGRLCFAKAIPELTQLFRLLSVSVVLLILGGLLALAIPVNKVLWTSSFSLITSGISGLLLMLFFGLFDVLKWRWLGFFFVIIGVNSIAIYLSTALIHWQYLSDSLFAGVIGALPENVQPIMSVLALILVEWIVLYFCYRRELLFKV